MPSSPASHELPAAVRARPAKACAAARLVTSRHRSCSVPREELLERVAEARPSSTRRSWCARDLGTGHHKASGDLEPFTSSDGELEERVPGAVRVRATLLHQDVDSQAHEVVRAERIGLSHHDDLPGRASRSRKHHALVGGDPAADDRALQPPPYCSRYAGAGRSETGRAPQESATPGIGERLPDKPHCGSGASLPAAYSRMGTSPAAQALMTGVTTRHDSSASSPRMNSIGSLRSISRMRWA